MDKDLTVYPVKVDDSKLNVIDKYPLAPIPFLICVIGRVKSGKSVLLSSLSLSPRMYGDDFQVKIFISSTAKNDPVNSHIVENFDYVFEEYSTELMKEIVDMIEKDDSGARFLLVLDDIIGDLEQKKTGKVDYLSSLATKYRHVGNGEQEGKLSIIITTQYFKFLTPIMRNNCSAYYLMGRFSKNELNKMAEGLSFFGGDEKEFLKLFERSKQKPYDFLFLNVSSLEARRNHDEILWKPDDMEKPDEPNLKEIEEKEK